MQKSIKMIIILSGLLIFGLFFIGGSIIYLGKSVRYGFENQATKMHYGYELSNSKYGGLGHTEFIINNE